jgi:FKBP-type peptidyl-prolyl cis-trans isomerase (trigger factor)
MIDDFDRGVRGLKAGESGEFDATFPADYRAENLAGKTVTFAVEVKSVTEPKLPELDDEFFKGFGIEEGGEEAFRVDVRRNMEQVMSTAVRNAVKTQVMDQLSAVAGGSIRNIAMNAAFLAADASQPVRMCDLLHAARTEGAKTDKPPSDAEVRDWI